MTWNPGMQAEGQKHTIPVVWIHHAWVAEMKRDANASRGVYVRRGRIEFVSSPVTRILPVQRTTGPRGFAGAFSRNLKTARTARWKLCPCFGFNRRTSL